MYPSGITRPSINGKVLNAYPACIPATNAPDTAVVPTRQASSPMRACSGPSAAGGAASRGCSTPRPVCSSPVKMANAHVRCAARRYGDTRGMPPSISSTFFGRGPSAPSTSRRAPASRRGRRGRRAAARRARDLAAQRKVGERRAEDVPIDRPSMRCAHSQKKIFLKSSSANPVPACSRWYSGNSRYRANSASHSAASRGHRLPSRRQSVIERPTA